MDQDSNSSGSMHGDEDDEESRLFLDDEGDEGSQGNVSNSDEDDQGDVVPEIQWPQSYRKSMDIYSLMPSPNFGFLTSAASRSSLLIPSESTTSLVEPLVPPEDRDEVVLDIIPPADTQLNLAMSTVKCPPETYTDYHMKPPEQGCSVLQTTMNGINVLAGVGVLSTPFALKEVGWIGVPLVIILALLCCYTGILLRRCLDSSPGLVTYPDIGQRAFGRVGRILVSIMLYMELFLCCVEFLILLGDNLSSLFPKSTLILWGLSGHKLFTVIATCFILPTVLIRDLSYLSYISAGGVLSSIIVAFSVLWVGAVDGVGFHHTGQFANLRKLPVAMGLFGFCFSGHAIFPNIYSSMKNSSLFNRVLYICFGFCIVLYGGMAVMGYTMFGPATVSQVTLNLPKQFFASRLALWTTVITPLTKYALSITPVALSLEELLPNGAISKHYSASLVIRVVLVVSTLLVALVVPFFGFVMALIGSFLSVTGSLILPCACYLSIERGKLTFRQTLVSVLTILVGVIAAITGTYSSVSSIVHQFSH